MRKRKITNSARVSVARKYMYLLEYVRLNGNINELTEEQRKLSTM